MSAPEAAHAGAWTLPKGSGEIIVSGLYSEALARFGSGGEVQPVPVFQKVELAAFGAYGLTDWLTATARTELRTEASGVPVVLDEARFGLSGLGGRIRLWEGEGAVLSSEFSVAVPTGRAARRWEGDPDAEIDLRLLAGYGRALGSWTGFVDVEGAYRLRPGAPNDEIRADVTLGLRPRPRLLWLAQSFNTFGAVAAMRPAGANTRRRCPSSTI